MSSLLKPEYAIRPNFLLFKSRDGKPVRAIYPPWGYIYKEQCQEARQQHNYGKLDANGNRDRQKCLAHVVNILKSCDIEFAKQIFNMVDPVSLSTEPKDGRTYKAYGMHAALACGMELDYDRLIKQAQQIQQLSFSNSTKAIHLKQMMSLELKQSNYIGSMLYSPTVLTSSLNNVVRQLTTTLKLGPNEVKQLETMVSDILNSNCANLNTYIDNATKMIEAGKFLMPRDDEAIKKACVDYPQQMLTQGLSKLMQMDKYQLASMYKIDSNLDMAKYILNNINANYNKTVQVPSPNATHEELKNSAFVDEQEAREVRDNTLNGKESPNVANSDDVASTYDSYEILGSGMDHLDDF